MNKVSLFLWLSFISLLGISHGNALTLDSKEQTVLKSGLFPNFGTQKFEFLKDVNKKCLKTIRNEKELTPLSLVSNKVNCLGLNEKKAKFEFSELPIPGVNCFDSFSLWFESMEQANQAINKILSSFGNVDYSVIEYTKDNPFNNIKVYHFLGRVLLLKKDEGLYKLCLTLDFDVSLWILGQLYVQEKNIEPLKLGSVKLGETTVHDLKSSNTCRQLSETSSTVTFSGQCFGFPFESQTVEVILKEDKVIQISYLMRFKNDNTNQSEKTISEVNDLLWNSLKKTYGDPTAVGLDPVSTIRYSKSPKNLQWYVLDEGIVPYIEYHRDLRNYILRITATTPIFPMKSLVESFEEQKAIDKVVNQKLEEKRQVNEFFQ